MPRTDDSHGLFATSKNSTGTTLLSISFSRTVYLLAGSLMTCDGHRHCVTRIGRRSQL